MAGLAPQVLATLALVLGAMLVFSGVTPARGIDLEWLEQLPAAAADRGRALPRQRARGAPDDLGPRPRLPARRRLVDGARRRLRRAGAVAGQGGGDLRGGGAGALRRGAPRLAPRLRPPLDAARAAADAALARRGRGGADQRAASILRFVFDHAEFGAESWLRFEISGRGAARPARALRREPARRPRRDLVAAAPGARTPATAAERRRISRARSRSSTAQPVAAANLVRMGDKRLIFSDDGRGFVMYGRQGSSWIALFDPVGPLELWPELIWRFVETAREAGGRAGLLPGDAGAARALCRRRACASTSSASRRGSTSPPSTSPAASAPASATC